MSSAKGRLFCLGLNELTEITAWISSYLHVKHLDVIPHLGTNTKDDFLIPPLKLGHGWVITTHKNNGRDCLTMRKFQLISGSKKGSQSVGI